MISYSFRIDGDELSGAKSAVRKLMNDTDCPLCNTQQLTQPPSRLSVAAERRQMALRLQSMPGVAVLSFLH